MEKVGDFLANVDYFLYIVGIKTIYMYKIYKLIDPISKDVKYVGKTTQELYERLAGHVHETIYRKRKFSKDKKEWMINLLKNNRIPEIHLLEDNIEIINSREREIYWVKYYSKDNMLYNIIFNDDEELLKFRSDLKSKVIYQYDLFGNYVQSWKSITDASNHLKVDSGNICYAASGKRKLCANYQWRYSKENFIGPYRKDISTKIVYKYDLKGNFICSYRSAKEIPDTNYKCVSKCCNGDLKSHKGFYYSYVKKEVVDIPQRIRKSKI